MSEIQFKGQEEFMESPIRKFISTFSAHPDTAFPAWLTAAVGELVVEVSQPQVLTFRSVEESGREFNINPADCGPRAAGSGQEKTIGAQIEDYIDSTVENARARAAMATADSSDSPPPAASRTLNDQFASIDPGERLDIDRILIITTQPPNSQTQALQVIARCAGIVRVLARVLALKHAKPDEATAVGASIVQLTETAKQLRELAGGVEMDFSLVAVQGPQAVGGGQGEEKPKRERKKRNWTPEMRAAQAERMRKVSLEMHARKRSQDGEGGEPVSGATFPAAVADGSAAA